MSTTTPESQSAAFPALWRGLVDDAATFPPGNAPLDDAVAAHRARRDEPWADLVGSFVVKDIDLPKMRGFDGPLSVIVTGGAGQLGAPIQLAERLGLDMKSVEISLANTGDLADNARRVVAAFDDSGADDDLALHVELPVTRPSGGWLAAADEAASREFRLKFRTGGTHPDDFPDPATLAACIDASLDREMPFKATAGLHHAVRHDDADGVTHHGFLNLLLATAAAWDGAGRQSVVATLAEQDADRLIAQFVEMRDDLPRSRRWFTSFGCCDVGQPRIDLKRFGLLD